VTIKPLLKKLHGEKLVDNLHNGEWFNRFPIEFSSGNKEAAFVLKGFCFKHIIERFPQYLQFCDFVFLVQILNSCWYLE